MRSIASTALLVTFAGMRGLSTESVLRDSGIRPEQLQDPNQEITLSQEIAVLRNVVAGVGDEPGMGLMAGLLCHAPGFGILGFALLNCATLRQVHEIAIRYVDQSFAIARHTLEEHGDEVWLVRDDSAVPADLRRFSAERDFAAAATIHQDLLTGRVPVQRVEIAFDAHPVYEMFGAMTGSDALTFGAERTIAVWRAATLDSGLPQANPTMARYYEQQCEEVLRRRRGRTGVSAEVRALLIRRGRSVDQSRIASDLGVGARTLRRWLAQEGTTFRELSAETIGMLAQQLLLTGLTVEQVAERLGYSSVSAFTSAFRGWKGQSPGTFARANRSRISTRR